MKTSHVDCTARAINAHTKTQKPETGFAYALLAVLLLITALAAVPHTHADAANPDPTLQHQWLLDTDPGWAMEGEWEFGAPQGLGGNQFGNPDPTSGYTGDNVYGVNLYGDYAIDIGGPYCLTIGPLDMTDITQSSLHFWRWLNTDWLPWVSAKIQVSNDNVDWVTLWENQWVEITDDAWNHWELDMSATADNRPTVWIRWSHEVLEGGTWAYSGWNIDDVEIWGVPLDAYPPGDLNCDGAVTFDDIPPFVSALNGQAAYEELYPGCNWFNADTNLDGEVNFDDITPFVALIGS